MSMATTVDAITKISITGNVIPPSWYRAIRNAGRADPLSCLILADVIYWYRGTELRDEVTGETTGYKKKFKADKLQKNYQAYADMFGVPKSSVKASVDRMVESGILTREFRTVDTPKGPLYNVMFLEPIPEKIIEITYGEDYSLEAETETVSDHKADSVLVLEYLNERAGTKFKATAKGNLAKVEARLREGYTVDDCKKVIDNQVSRWKGTEWAQYLRPATLFNNGDGKRQFEGYLNAAPIKNGLTRPQRSTVDQRLEELIDG